MYYSKDINNIFLKKKKKTTQKLLHSINNTRSSLYKMKTNLPARLMNIKDDISENNNNINNNNTKNKNNKNISQNMLKLNKPYTSNDKSYYKSISSSYSSVTKDGNTHSQGKKITNVSTKPFLQVEEMHDGHTQHFFIPKNTIKTLHVNNNNVRKGKTKDIGKKSIIHKPKSHKSKLHKETIRKPKSHKHK